MRPLMNHQRSNTTTCPGSRESDSSMDWQQDDCCSSKQMTNLELSTSLVVLEQEWGLLRDAQPNVLVVGADRVVNDA